MPLFHLQRLHLIFQMQDQLRIQMPSMVLAPDHLRSKCSHAQEMSRASHPVPTHHLAPPLPAVPLTKLVLVASVSKNEKEYLGSLLLFFQTCLQSVAIVA